MKTKALRTLFALTFCTMPAQAIILLGLDNSGNLTDPGSGAPFASVARLSNGMGAIGGSGIYLGNGYILTANHVGPFSSVTFDGVTHYTHDGVTPQQVGTTDMKVFRLTTTPTVAAVSLYTGSSELTASGTLVGWGVGRNPATGVGATIVPWGAAATSDKRWGLNSPTGIYDDFRSGPLTYDILQTTLGSNGGMPPGLGASEAAATLYDSGSALFQFLDGGWHLTGLTTNVTQQSGGSTSTFGNDVPGVFSPAVLPATDTQVGLFPGAGDINIFVRVGSYASDINTIIPEPSALVLAFSTLIMFLRRRRSSP